LRRGHSVTAPWHVRSRKIYLSIAWRKRCGKSSSLWRDIWGDLCRGGWRHLRKHLGPVAGGRTLTRRGKRRRCILLETSAFSAPELAYARCCAYPATAYARNIFSAALARRLHPYARRPRHGVRCCAARRGLHRAAARSYNGGAFRDVAATRSVRHIVAVARWPAQTLVAGIGRAATNIEGE